MSDRDKQEFEMLLEDARGISSKLDKVEFATFYQDMDTFTNTKDRIKILQLWLRVVNDRGGNDLDHIKQQKYLKNMEELYRFRNEKLANLVRTKIVNQV